MIRNVYAVYFSAVGNTKKVVERIAAQTARAFGAPLSVIDFTLPSARKEPYCFEAEDLVVFGTPTYAGRVPNKVLPFVQELFKGNGTPAAAVVTYGNRNFDSSLTELAAVLKEDGFLPLAAGAFACRHVFSDVIAAGRPDEEDLRAIDAFAAGFCGKAKAGSGQAAEAAAEELLRKLNEFHEVGPYYTPLGTDGKPAMFLKAKPVVDETLCDRCGICAKVCPMGSIDPSDVLHTAGICIKCHACIRKCPKQARHIEDPAFLSHREMLETNYQRRSEPTAFV